MMKFSSCKNIASQAYPACFEDRKLTGWCRVAILATGLVFSIPAFAKDGFDDGSFNDTPVKRQVTQPKTPKNAVKPGGRNEICGSFDENCNDGAPRTKVVRPVPPKRQGKPGNDNGICGSFDDNCKDAPPKRRVVQPTPPRGGDAPGGDDPFDKGGDFEQVDVNPPKDKGRRPPRKKTVVVPVQPDRRKGPIKRVGPKIDRGILAFETRDFGVRPTNKLRTSNMHAPTPTSIPGGRVITTAQLVGAMKSKQQFLIVDVLGGQYTLPRAYSAPAMARGGYFQDRIQQQTNQWLRKITRGNGQMALVILCSDPYCWLSYNASLRAIAAGYKNVYWYRGGMQAWNMAGLQTVPASF